MTANGKASVCGPASKLIFACSGAADVGEISDKAARKLTEDGAGKMFCLAGIGGKVEPIISAAKSASI
ncbi:MAG: putative zinc-binding protein, partial [Planctomycetota bacterium]